MSRTYNIDSTRNYDIDGRTYHNTSNESRSRINSARQSDVDARNYSNAMHNTGGAKIFSFKGGGTGKMITGTFSYVLMWSVVGVIVFLAFQFLWPLIKKWKNVINPSVGAAIEKENQEVAKHSSDRMSNGDTYLGAATYLFDEMYSDTLLPWAKDTDHEIVGNYMLTVKSAEFVQLSSTFSLVSKERRSWYHMGEEQYFSLTDALKKLFSSSEKTKYLSHLGVF